MRGIYVDTSALGRVLLRESGDSAVLACLSQTERRLASRLLRLELVRLALRMNEPGRADQLLKDVALIPISREVLGAAESVQPADVASLDAIHLVTALRMAERGQIDAMLTYDQRLADGAHHHGLEVLSPA